MGDVGDAHLIRHLKLSSRLAQVYLCIRHPAAETYVMLKIEDALHHSIPKMSKNRETELSEEVFLKALQRLNQRCRMQPC